MTQSSKDAVILLGRGGYSSAPEEQLGKLVTHVQSTGRYLQVQGAVVDHGTPSLPNALGICADAGANRILVVPVFMPDDRNLSRWLAKIIRRWSIRREGADIKIVLANSLGDQLHLHEAVAQVVRETETKKSLSIDSSAKPEFGEPDWSIIPLHNAHVLTCRGPRCATRGSGELWNHLANRLDEKRLDSILVAQTGCLYPCNLGPVMVVYPEGVWYCGLTKCAIDRIVDEHFLGGQVVQEYALSPASHAQKRPGLIEDDV